VAVNNSIKVGPSVFLL